LPLPRFCRGLFCGSSRDVSLGGWESRYIHIGIGPKKTKKSKTTTNKKQTVGEATAQEKNPKKAYNKSSAKAETCFGHRAK